MIFTHNWKDPITKDVGILELLFPWQHSSLIYTGCTFRSVGNRIALKRYEISPEQIVQFDEQYDV